MLTDEGAGQVGYKSGPRWAERSQERSRWPPKDSLAYDPWISEMIGTRLGGHFGSISGYLRASGADLEVSWQAFGWYLEVR